MPPELQEQALHSTAVTAPSPTRAEGVKRALKPYRRGFFLLLLPLSLLLTELAAANPAFTERYFSRGLYRGFTNVFGRLFGLLPFSVAELLIYALAIAVLSWLLIHITGFIRKRDWRTRLPSMLATLCCAAGIGYFLFTLLCGLNYHRVTFAEQSGLAIRPSSTQELAQLYQELVGQVNSARQQVRVNDAGEMIVSEDSLYQTAAKVPEAMERAARAYPALEGYTPRAKPVLNSRGMSYIDITGVYIPFTFEGNVNVDVPHYNIPFSMVHELAHFKGFMREDEANFIAYLGCRELDDPAYLYSGTVLALIHTGNALYRADPERYYQLYALLSEEVRGDFAANSAYWQQFEGPVAQVASQVNDSYLKSNRQTQGVQSYGRMVDLLLADYRARHGEV